MINNNSNTSQPLEMKDYIRYLGILIDSNLSWITFVKKSVKQSELIYLNNWNATCGFYSDFFQSLKLTLTTRWPNDRKKMTQMTESWKILTSIRVSYFTNNQRKRGSPFSISILLSGWFMLSSCGRIKDLMCKIYKI